jgi:HPt (histidine-containing phosphotransfer) domain-containing protein
MKERANLNYIEKLSGGDKAFQVKLIGIIKSEFPEEVRIYHDNLKSNNYELAASNVHKIKHKISILGLEKGYGIAEEFENDLHRNDTHLSNEFNEILESIFSFLDTL